MKFCPKCGTKNEDGAIVCKTAGCGHRFAAGGGTKRPALPGSTGSGRRYCPKCGTGNAADAAKCVRCAAPFPDATRPAATKARGTRGGGRRSRPARNGWQRVVAAVSRWSLLQKAAAALVACAALWGVGAMLNEDSAKQQSGAARSQRPVAGTQRATKKPSSGPDAELQAQAGQIAFSHLNSARAYSDSEWNILEQYYRDCGWPEDSIANARQWNEQQRLQDFMYDLDMAHYANMHNSHMADMAQLEADAKIQADSDWLHDFHLARTDHMSVDQYRTIQNLGIINSIGYDSVGAIGGTLNGDVWRVDSGGNKWIRDNGNWYSR